MIIRHHAKVVNMANVFSFVKGIDKELEFTSPDGAYIFFGFPSKEERDDAFNTILSGIELGYLLIEL